MKKASLEEFYKQLTTYVGVEFNAELTPGIGHFNVFNIAELVEKIRGNPVMPYDKKVYYKISLMGGRSRTEYADKVIDIDKNALVFASPKLPYHWVPKDFDQSGYFCVFTDEFISQTPNGEPLDSLPIFKGGGFPAFGVSETETADITAIFKKMQKELSSDYIYKEDLLKNYILELIHYGQKLQPFEAQYPTHDVTTRVSTLFIELLERQFPIASPQKRLKLRTAKDYADHLSVHVNHLNRVLKEHTGQTTTSLISSRVIKEAKFLLKQTNQNISEIAYLLGFEEVAHFSNFFRKQTTVSPMTFREV